MWIASRGQQGSFTTFRMTTNTEILSFAQNNGVFERTFRMTTNREDDARSQDDREERMTARGERRRGVR
jgi:hypothetical protein